MLSRPSKQACGHRRTHARSMRKLHFDSTPCGADEHFPRLPVPAQGHRPFVGQPGVGRRECRRIQWLYTQGAERTIAAGGLRKLLLSSSTPPTLIQEIFRCGASGLNPPFGSSTFKF